MCSYFIYFGVQYFLVFFLNHCTSISVDCTNCKVCGPNYVVILRNWILTFELYMAKPRVKIRHHKIHGTMRLDAAQNIGSIVNTVGRAHLIAFERTRICTSTSYDFASELRLKY